MKRSPTDPSVTSRRTVLRRGGATLAGAVFLAGCTEDIGEELPPNEHWPVAEIVPELPVHQRKDVLEEGIEKFAGDEIEGIEEFVAMLAEHGFEFEAVEVVADTLSLEYIEPAPERRGTLEVTALVAGAYAALVAGGFEAFALELVFFTPDGMTIGVVEIDTEWAIGYNEGELSAGEYGELVSGTIESKREPPEPEVGPAE